MHCGATASARRERKRRGPLRRGVMTCLALVFVAMSLGAQGALAQMNPSATLPLGATSPLGLGPAAPVGPVGVPLGATQLATPGVSPAPPGSFIPGTISGSTAGCSSTAGLSATPGMSDPTALFDGGASAGTASGACATAGSVASNPAASASSPGGFGGEAAVGRPGIPMGSSELVPGGLSPLPPATTTVAPALPMTQSPLTSAPMLGAAPGMTQGSPFAPTPLTTGHFASCPGLPGNEHPSSIPGTPTFGPNSC